MSAANRTPTNTSKTISNHAKPSPSLNTVTIADMWSNAVTPPPVQRLGPVQRSPTNQRPSSPPTVQDPPKRKREGSDRDDTSVSNSNDELSLASIASMISALSVNVSSVQDTISSVKDKVIENTNKLDTNTCELKAEIANLSVTVKNLSDKQYELMKENMELKAEIANVKSEVVNLKAVFNSKEEMRTKEIEAEIAARDDLEAQQRRYNLTISGIVKQSDSENCKDICNQLFAKLVRSYNPNQLDICHRTSAGQLICRFATRSARDEVFKQGKEQMKVKTTMDFDLPGNNIRNKIYFNESLTFLRARIHRAARIAVNTFNVSHPLAKQRAIIHKGLVKIADAKGELHTMMTLKAVEEYFN